MIISAIAAISENRVIGKDNAMPWHLPADMRYFRKVTTGHHIIMGRKNFDAIKKPLPNRTNIVLTRNENWSEPGCIRAGSLEEALQIARDAGEEECFIIGGGEIYREALPLLDQVYLTILHQKFDGDTFFPVLGSKWKESWCEDHFADEKNPWDWSFVLYTPS